MKNAEKFLRQGGPPNSPPMQILLITNVAKQSKAVAKNKATEKARVPAGTAYISPVVYCL